MSLTIFLHDDCGDHVFERFVQVSQTFDTSFEAGGRPLTDLQPWHLQQRSVGSTHVQARANNGP